MATKITNYQCPACTGPLHFSAGSGKLECEFCGSSFEVAEIEKLYEEKEKAAAAALEAEEMPDKAPEEAPKAETVSEDDLPEAEDLNTDWGEDAGKMRAYLCPSCGAELICEQTTAATACPYCGNPSVVPGQLSGALKPEFVLPFKVEKDAVVEALHKHYGKHNYYLPRLFRSENNIQKVQGVYVPFWLFDAQVSGLGKYDGQDSMTQRKGDYNVTTTMHYNVERGGTAKFDKVPVDASKKMPDNYMDSLEPFDYTQLKDFSTAYLPGFLADRFDVSAEEASPRMEARCKDTLEHLLRSDIDHAVVVPESFQAKVDKKEAHYALLPVWMLTTKWRDKTYLFAMNGQTGKFVGELPTDNGLFWRNLGILTLILTLVLRFSGITRFLLGLF